jgi:hypothetical protein
MIEEYRANRNKFYENAKELHEDEQREHRELNKKIEDLQQFKQKWVYMVMGGVAVLGWITGHLDKILGFVK